MNEQKVAPCCALCQQTPERGIAGGWWIGGFFLCDRCWQAAAASTDGEGVYDELFRVLRERWRHHRRWRRYLVPGGGAIGPRLGTMKVKKGRHD
ncbi:hypothetical protein [Heliophilum fasciatum]|uniref:Inhibitor of sigma-G Gin protein n=1 Tax=Heliophilum fasciatum TaxID=35700 RepID=A0A4R2RZZ6_9FIRM|nr:hypothetical protein [Heliophilum fasciatum]MCW2276997.1 hypothetical protein [Heliophilum fasciatum]TCP68477.1 hypothetical protein EDD73_103108 [Heliophilum fasciatum]